MQLLEKSAQSFWSGLSIHITPMDWTRVCREKMIHEIERNKKATKFNVDVASHTVVQLLHVLHQETRLPKFRKAMDFGKRVCACVRA